MHDQIVAPILLPHRARSPFIWIERGKVCADSHGLIIKHNDAEVEIPVAAVSTLVLEPGVTITHEAVKLASEHHTLIIWVGEAGVRIYSCGNLGGMEPSRLLKQAQMHFDINRRLECARRLYCLMFDDPMPATRSLEKLRGMEGARVKAIYQDIASEYGIDWEGRGKGPKSLDTALGFATSCLYGLSEVAIHAKGYSPALGIVHNGNARSLVYDLADTVKFKTVVPAAFSVWKEGENDIGNRVRRRCRDIFRECRLADNLFRNLEYIMGERDALGRSS